MRLSPIVKKREIADITGVCLSFMCMIHCLLLPLLAFILPVIGFSFLLHETTENIIFIGAILLAIGSISWGLLEHKKWQILILLIGAIFLFFTSSLITSSYEIYFHIGIGLLLTISHLINRFLCKNCQKCQEE